jgi:hypothetical protein
MKRCNYCFKLIPSGYDIWWNQRTYHPDCAIQVAVTEINRNTQNNRNTEINRNTKTTTERREFEMNCRYCEKHIVATCQVMWRGYPFHEDCLAKAIQEANQPSKEELQNRSVEEHDRFFSEDSEAEDTDYNYDYEPDFDARNEDEEFSAGDDSPELESEYFQAESEQALSTKIAAPPAQANHSGQTASAATATARTTTGRVESNGNNAGTLITHCGARRITREELVELPVPEETRTFKPISHSDLIEKIIETLWYRRMTIVRDEYAVSQDGMKLFGLLEMDLEYKGVRFAIGIRNSNDKSMRVAMVAGYKVTVCDNMMLQGDFQPLLAKHSKNFALEDGLSIACDRIQRNVGKLHGEINRKQEQVIESRDAKSLLYTAFTDGRFPISLFRAVHREFFIAPSYEEFKGSTMWSLENAFTTSFKKLNPVSQFEMTARLGKFLAAYN